MLKVHTEYLWFNTKKHREYVNMTETLAEIVKRSAIQDGFLLVSAMHITAGIYVNDAEEGLIQDIDEWLERLCPYRDNYQHHRTGETNGDSHLKNLLIGHQQIIPITQAKLDLGPWEQIYYAEFDGKRRKRVVVKILGT